MSPFGSYARDMTQLTPRIQTILKLAAELRATGASWEAVSRRLARAASTVRGWTRQFPEVWAQEYTAAVAALGTETSAEARLVLRELLRSDNEKIRFSAAQALLRIQQQEPASQVESASGNALLAELEQLSDEDLARLAHGSAP